VLGFRLVRLIQAWHIDEHKSLAADLNPFLAHVLDDASAEGGAGGDSLKLTWESKIGLPVPELLIRRTAAFLGWEEGLEYGGGLPMA